MKKTIQFSVVLMLVTVPLAVSAHGYGGSSSSVSIGIGGGSGSFHYSRQHYNRSCGYQRTVIRAGTSGSYYGGNHSVYYGSGYYGSGRGNHIHRQEGRRYVNDFPCAPVVVVPATNRYHRHYRGCGCGY